MQLSILVNGISEGMEELVETLPGVLSTKVKANLGKNEGVLPELQGSHVYQKEDISPISKN